MPCTQLLKIVYTSFLVLIIALKGTCQMNNLNTNTAAADVSRALNALEIDEDLFNGKLNTTIPIYSYDFENINLPISLSYTDGNGIKTNEVPGITGQGWYLKAGGFVHRTVRGKPDEQNDFKSAVYTNNSDPYWGPRIATGTLPTDYSYFSNKSVLASAGWFSNAFAQSKSSNGPQSYSAPYGPTNGDATVTNEHPYYDLVSDEYSFSVGNVSGKFYLNHLNKWIVVANDNKNYSIVVNSGPQTVVDYWSTITNLRTYYIVPRLIKSFVISSDDGVKYYFGNANPNAAFADQYFDYSRASLQLNVFDPTSFHPYFEMNSMNTTPMLLDLFPDTWHLTKIENIKTGSFVTFNYKQDGLQTYKSNQAWGFGGTSANIDFVVYKNEGQLYYPGPSAPMAQTLTPLSKVLSRAWTLTSISYSSGIKVDLNSSHSTQMGANELINGPNNCGFIRYPDLYLNSLENMGTVSTMLKLDNIKIYFNNALKKEVDFNYGASPSGRLQLSEVKFKNSSINQDQKYSFQYNNAVPLPSYDSRNTDHWGFYNNQDFFSTILPPYSYSKLLGYSNFRNPDPNFTQAEILKIIKYPTGGRVEFEYEQNSFSKVRNVGNLQISAVSNNPITGGIRIKSAKYYDETTGLAYQKDFEYKDPVTNASSGVLSSPPDIYLTGNASLYDFRAKGYSGLTKENHITYTFASERIPGTGKTTYQFTNFENGFNDRPIIEGSSIIDEIGVINCNQSFKRGRPISIALTDENGTLVNKKAFHYEHENDESSKDELRSLYLGRGLTPNNAYSSVLEKIYPDFTTTITDENFFSSSAIAQNSTSVFDSKGNVKQLITTDSRGKVFRKKFYYSYEFPATGTDAAGLGIKNLLQLGISNAVIEEIETVEDATGNNKQVLRGFINVYKSDAPFLSKIYRLQLFDPIAEPSYSLSAINSNGIYVMDPNYGTQPETTFDFYDAKGNVLQQHDRNNISKSFLWNRFLYPIAEVGNAGVEDIAYTSFEDGINGGIPTFNWQNLSSGGGNANSFVFDNTSPSGTFAFDLQQINTTQYNYLKKAGLNSNKVYFVSYWTKNTTPFSILGTQAGYPQTGKSIDGWTNFLHKISNQTEIRISGQGRIDEVRLYPELATMQTSYYEPTVGIKYTCNANNTFTSFEYDGLGRLSIVRDENHNIIKRNCYTVSGNIENCGYATTPNLIATGQTRCKLCPANTNYSTGELEAEYVDINIQSSTYNNHQWIVVPGTSSCPTSPSNWQPNGVTQCQTDLQGVYTGYMVYQIQDMNPCSPSGGMTNWMLGNYNPSFCQNTTCIDCVNDTDKKCINQVCETGNQIVIGHGRQKVYRDGQWIWVYTCVYAYCFSDGSLQGESSEETSGPDACVQVNCP